jgi:hypothetical protein
LINEICSQEEDLLEELKVLEREEESKVNRTKPKEERLMMSDSPMKQREEAQEDEREEVEENDDMKYEDENETRFNEKEYGKYLIPS